MFYVASGVAHGWWLWVCVEVMLVAMLHVTSKMVCIIMVGELSEVLECLNILQCSITLVQPPQCCRSCGRWWSFLDSHGATIPYLDPFSVAMFLACVTGGKEREGRSIVC